MLKSPKNEGIVSRETLNKNDEQYNHCGGGDAAIFISIGNHSGKRAFGGNHPKPGSAQKSKNHPFLAKASVFGQLEKGERHNRSTDCGVFSITYKLYG
jgi:hypothetical protein